MSKPFFITYSHQPTLVDPGLLALSIGLSNTPILDNFNDKVELLEVPAALAVDENTERPVLMTFLSPTAID